MRYLPAVIGSLLVLSACRMNDEERKDVLESAQRNNIAIANGAVVRDLRSPSDSGRVIYAQPTHLSQQTAMPAGAQQVWAPFGIATPDTVASSAARTQQP